MKKIFAIILLIGIMTAALGAAESQKPLGHLTKLGVDEATLNENIRNTSAFQDIPFSEYRYYDTLNSMILALNTGVIDGFITNEYTYDYLKSQSDLYSTYSTDPAQKYTFGFAMLLREEDRELCDRISQIILQMKEDGTINELKGKYIDGGDAWLSPEVSVPETIDQAPTLKVAVTGDIPPMDYTLEDGSPAGFNTAFVSEVGRRLGMNIVFVPIDSGARAISLATGESDVVFWTEAANYYNWDNADQEDQPENTVATEIYLPAEIRLVVLKTFPGADQ